MAEGKRSGTRMLILTPTRELAQQIHDVLMPLGRTLGLKTACVYGGAGMQPQTQALRRGCDIIVACPGRLLDHIQRGNCLFDKLDVVVLDEADRMLDMGFLPDIRRIVEACPRERQTLMFSATFPKEIERMAASMQYKPERIEVGRISSPAKAVRQGVYTVGPQGKTDLLMQILSEKDVGPALVFLRTKHRTDRIARTLEREGLAARAIHGGRSQRQRQQAIEGFRKGKYRVLVATDVAARGLDIQGITHIVNYDIPKNYEDYVHRIGRTARASAEGDAITFVCADEAKELGAIERGLGRSIAREDWEGAVPVASQAVTHKERPNQKRGARNANRSRRRSRPPHAAR
jgi:ATP-dependent RNA helicase RhlE